MLRRTRVSKTNELPITDMSIADRKRLVQVACVAAWSDADLAAEEREFVLKLAKALELDDEAISQVAVWLKHGPPDLDPNVIPRQHKATFLEVFRAVVAADGYIDPEESEVMILLDELLS